MTTMTFKNPLARFTIENIIAALADGKRLSSREIADAVHRDRSGVSRYLNHLRLSRPKVIYVADHELRGGRWTPLYALGELPCKPEPVHKTTPSARRNAKTQWMKKNDPAAYLDRLMKQRAQTARRALAAKAAKKVAASWIDSLMAKETA